MQRYSKNVKSIIMLKKSLVKGQNVSSYLCNFVVASKVLALTLENDRNNSR